jgi:hypothetical protein
MKYTKRKFKRELYFQSNPKREDGKNKNSQIKILSKEIPTKEKRSHHQETMGKSIAQDTPKRNGLQTVRLLTKINQTKSILVPRLELGDGRPKQIWLHHRHLNQNQQCGVGHPNPRKSL